MSSTCFPPPPPTIVSIAPAFGDQAGGTFVTITGTNLTGATEVTVGEVHVSNFIVNSPTEIGAVMPPHAAGTVDIVVTTVNGTTALTAADRYTYT